MFFRREKPHSPSFDERLRDMERFKISFAKKQSGKAVAMRGRAAAVLTELQPNKYELDPIGIVVGTEIGELVDAGNQKYWLTPGGRKEAATAEQLQALHELTEDLREGLGMKSLYNEGLGTVNALHIYDRVQDRDRGVAPRVWERTRA
jgi:hypothetical protein